LAQWTPQPSNQPAAPEPCSWVQQNDPRQRPAIANNREYRTKF
jgi:hypothetical protein